MASVTFSGTTGDDIAVIEYQDKGYLVNVTLNGQVTENVDISEGLEIDLGDGNDRLTVDNTMGTLNAGLVIEVLNSEEISAVDGSNLWRVHDDVAAYPSVAATQIPVTRRMGMSGWLNDTVYFEGVHVLSGGEGMDQFNIHSLNHGTISGNGGDDIFRFGRGTMGTFVAEVSGGAGDDFFGVHGHQIVHLDGGDGNDHLSFNSSELDLATIYWESTQSQSQADRFETRWWAHGGFIDQVEVMRGIQGRANRLINASLSSPESGLPTTGLAMTPPNAQLSWVIDGRLSRAISPHSAQSTAFIDYASFQFAVGAQNEILVRSTATDIDIAGGGVITVASSTDLEQSTISGLNHDLSVRPGQSGDFDSYPTIELHHENGSPLGLEFRENVIQGMPGQGSILLLDSPTGSNRVAVSVFGSTYDDQFTVTETWNSGQLTIYGNDGNDSLDVEYTLLVSLGAADQSPITFHGGAGEDSVEISMMNVEPTALNRSQAMTYQISNNQVVAKLGTNTEAIQLANISFDDELESVSVIGVKNLANNFLIEPDEETTFIIDAAFEDFRADTVEIVGDGRYFPSRDGDGVWIFDNHMPIFLYGIESTFLTPTA